MFKKSNTPHIPEKVVDIDAGIQGNIKFSTPINLKINGKFEGNLETKGSLTIGQEADVKVKRIKGESIIILGKVKGDIICTNRLELSSSAKVIGNIEAPTLVVNEGAMLKGHCHVPIEDKIIKHKRTQKSKKKES